MSGTFEKREGEGALFTNKKITSERSPVMTGYIMWKGEEIRIAGWSKATSTGDKMLNLKAEPVQERGASNGGSPTGQHTGVDGQANGETVGGTGESIDDAIPF